MTTPKPGMDHGFYPYSALPTRPTLSWPGGKRLAFWVLLHLEYFELDPPKEALKDLRFQGEYGAYFPDYRPFTQREYGNRIGIFRILELLDRFDLKVTVAANSGAVERYPQLVDACIERGYEFAAHGEYQSRMITSAMSLAEERRTIEAATNAITNATGQRPLGWLGPESSESTLTPQLLAEAGYDYVLDWPNDDQPYWMTTNPGLVSIPNHMEWDDVFALWLRRIPNPRYPDIVGEAFRGLYDEAAASGRLFGLSLHPWVIGQSHRIKYLQQALEDITKFDNVWQTTAGEICRHFRNQTGAAQSS
jgi:allantoinase